MKARPEKQEQFKKKRSSGASEIPWRRGRRGNYRSNGGPIWGPATGRGIPEPTEKVDKDLCYTRNP
jgi:hypothetical protein